MAIMLALIPALALTQQTHYFKVENLVRRTIDGDLWTARNVFTYVDGLRRDELDVFELRENGRLVMKRAKQDNPLRNVAFIEWPFPAPLFVYSEHSWCGHGQQSWFYVIRKHKLVGPLIRVDREVGGPIFKDLDRDGRPEMIFDNNDWYEFYGAGPTQFRAYKVSPRYKITYWRTLRNPKRAHVRWKLPRF